MEARARVALAIGGGYLLGRTKKMRLAITLGSMVAGRKMSGPEGLVSQGLEMLRTAPEFEDLRGDLRQRLLEAGRSAALASAGNAVGRLTERVNGAGQKQLGNALDDDEQDDDVEDEYDDDLVDDEDDCDARRRGRRRGR